MMGKYITADDVRPILEQAVEKIKTQMVEINKNAVDNFYSVGSGSYNRTESFFNVVNHDPDESYSDTECTLVYKYSSSDVSVNPWESPWGITYPGNPEYAFISGFEHGFHGGPKPTTIESLYDFQNIKTKGGWTWARTKKTTSISDLIDEGINSITL